MRPPRRVFMQQRLVMQRLHEADLSARCLELGYQHLCLPVEADAATDIVFPVSDRVVTCTATDFLDSRVSVFTRPW